MDPRTKDGTRQILQGLGCDLTQALDQEGADKGAVTFSYEDALRDFQRKHTRIPPVEYGNICGAVTLWSLTQAALVVQKAETAATTTR